HARLPASAVAWSRRRSFARVGFSETRALEARLQGVERAAGALAEAGEGVARPPAEPAAEGEACAAMAAALRAYDEKRTSLFRIFFGSWRRARDLARPHLEASSIPDETETVL